MSRPTAAHLAARLAEVGTPPDAVGQYRIVEKLGACFVAVGQGRAAALLVPVNAPPTVPARRGGGYTLVPAAEVRFSFGGREWTQPAIAFECADASLLDTFLVLATDIAERLGGVEAAHLERCLVAAVDEWQTLLATRRALTAERQIGLWGELWLLCEAVNPDRLAAGWRGPEGGTIDFVLGGRGLEVKTSRHRWTHHMSQSQAGAPLGDLDAFLLSTWVAVDPVTGRSLANLADHLLATVTDAPALLRQLLSAGYDPADRDAYSTRYLVLEEPSWFRIPDVPRVTAADPGVSDMRYRVALDGEFALALPLRAELWIHFLGKPPVISRPGVIP